MKKTTLQWISLALVLLMSLGAVVSCSKGELPADTETTDTQATTDSETEAPADTTPPVTDENPNTGEVNKEPEGSSVTPNKICGSGAGIRLIGPRALIDKDRIYLDFMGSGFEIALKSNDGKVKDILALLKAKDYEGFLSLEPHLSDFTGFNALENGEEKQDKIFSDGHFAWQVALNALKGILYDLGM